MHVCKLCGKPIGSKSWMCEVKGGVRILIQHAYCWWLQLRQETPAPGKMKLVAINTRTKPVKTED